MKIKKIELKNYKRFTDFTIDNISASVKLVLVVGPNGSGKTSLFDAFNLWYRQHGRLGWNQDSQFYFKTNVNNDWEKLVSGNVSEAAAIHHHLLPLINALFVVSNPIPVKYALNHVGFNVGKPRLPLTEPDEKSAAFIKDTLKNYKIDLPM